MKKLIALLLLAALVLTVAGCSFERRNYAAVKLDTSFRVDFASWTNKDSSTISLEAGEVLHVSWNLNKGAMDIQIAVPGQEPIYTADGLTAENDSKASFDVTAPEAGEYRLSVSIKQASGDVEIRK